MQFVVKILFSTRCWIIMMLCNALLHTEWVMSRVWCVVYQNMGWFVLLGLSKVTVRISEGYLGR